MVPKIEEGTFSEGDSAGLVTLGELGLFKLMGKMVLELLGVVTLELELSLESLRGR